MRKVSKTPYSICIICIVLWASVNCREMANSFSSRQDSLLAKSVGEGKIFYQPDEADDFDEEDPDDDLDI